jgi:hypothetical protein
VAAVYCAVFAVGAFLTGSPASGAVYTGIAIVSFALIMRNLRADERLVASVDRTGASGLGFSQPN